jgi:hypothetical protein
MSSFAEFSWVPAGPALPTAHSNHSAGPFLVILGALALLLLLALVIIAICRIRRAPAVPKTPVSLPSQALSRGTNSFGYLIPPVFYTEGLRDPLMQEDLRESISPGSPEISRPASPQVPHRR